MDGKRGGDGEVEECMRMGFDVVEEEGGEGIVAEENGREVEEGIAIGAVIEDGGLENRELRFDDEMLGLS